jgi:hypothetical protein
MRIVMPKCGSYINTQFIEVMIHRVTERLSKPNPKIAVDH